MVDLLGNVGEIERIDSDEQSDESLQIDRKDSARLRDSYLGRLPESERTITVKFAWHEQIGRAHV